MGLYTSANIIPHEGRKMYNYIERNKDFLKKYHYIRFDSNDFSFLDIHYNVLDDYKLEYGRDFCVVLYAHRKWDDCYVIPFGHLENIFVPDFFCSENGDNLENNRNRWKFKISKHTLRLFRNIRTDKQPPLLDVSRFWNRSIWA